MDILSPVSEYLKAISVKKLIWGEDIAYSLKVEIPFQKSIERGFDCLYRRIIFLTTCLTKQRKYAAKAHRSVVSVPNGFRPGTEAVRQEYLSTRLH